MCVSYHFSKVATPSLVPPKVGLMSEVHKSRTSPVSFENTIEACTIDSSRRGKSGGGASLEMLRVKNKRFLKSCPINDQVVCHRNLKRGLIANLF